MRFSASELASHLDAAFVGPDVTIDGTGTQGRGDEVVPVTLRNDRDEELTRSKCPGVGAGPVDRDVGSDKHRVKMGGELRSREPHASSSIRLYSLG